MLAAGLEKEFVAVGDGERCAKEGAFYVRVFRESGCVLLCDCLSARGEAIEFGELSEEQLGEGGRIAPGDMRRAVAAFFSGGDCFTYKAKLLKRDQ